MKWRKLKDRKPPEYEDIYFRGTSKEYSFDEYTGHKYISGHRKIVWMDEHVPKDGLPSNWHLNNIEWLDESDAAFEEVARERGWIKEEEADRRLDSALFSQIHG